MNSSALAGKTVVVTRPREQAEDIIAKLEMCQAQPYLLPLIQTTWANDLAPLDQAIHRLDSYDGVLFSSVNGVRYFFHRAGELAAADGTNGVISRLNGLFVAAVGPATARALHKESLSQVHVPHSYKQEELVQLLQNRLQPGSRLLYPRAKVVRPHLLEQLVQSGFDVDDVVVYQTEYRLEGKEKFVRDLAQGKVDVVTFTSASTVKAFDQLLSSHKMPKTDLPVTIACIGPITAKEAEKRGIPVHVVAREHTVNGLIRALEDYYTYKG
ncbi:uroporphyrinogen-III synthase [Caldalkalibacillus uzonensis]|uniref:Uroporphyrinogen-III synthase n=1 Tax=Caldalkalibacillus uzonensis TaxID=353224 RepID=A0ABU0CTP8_9BACI|nr:uroporphyrinogen-III synthase [Caldalkalibacillus uzonensis]MDQ0339477.1 uroporphyrinogen-III synthase [Caldalkalibacillus uzonensis]